MSFGCLRYAHIARSEPRRPYGRIPPLQVPQRKTKACSRRIRLCCAGHLRQRLLLGQRSAGGLQDAGTGEAETCRPLFFGRRAPLTILEVQETMQQEMSVFLDNPEDLTTYSWRRLAPTVAQLLDCRPEEMAALGDWQAKSEQPEVGAMAFHYSSAKYAASIKVKSLIWGATA